MYLLEVPERFQDKKVHQPFRSESSDLLAKSLASFFTRRLAKWLDADPKRPDRPSHENAISFRYLAGQPRARAVHLVHLVATAMPRQAKNVAAEGVGLDHLGTGMYVIPVDPADDLGLRDVQLVVAPVDEDSLVVEHSPHRA